MNLINQLLTSNAFSPTEKIVVKYILENTDVIPYLTITELSDLTNTSHPVIIRMCKKLGFDGFKNFKVKFSSDLEKYRQSKTQVDVNYPFQMDENILEISNNIAILTKTTIDTCYKELNTHTLHKVSNLINNCDNVYLFSTGDSHIRAQSFKYKLIKIGKKTIDASSNDEDISFATFSKPKDCAIFISYSGMIANHLYCARILKANKTTIITITAKTYTQLAKLSDYVISFPDLENSVDSIGTFYSQIALEYILNVLYSLIYSLHYQKNKEVKKISSKLNHPTNQ